MWVIYFFYILLLFQGSVNQFFVKGEGSILYTHNNGKLANDPKLACQNFLSALERIPKVIATHEKELAKATKDIDVYKAISTGVWNQEQSGQHQSIGNGNTAGSPLDASKTFKSASTYAQTSTPQKEERQDIMSKVVFSRPKMR